MTRYTHPNGEVAFHTNQRPDGRVEILDSQGRSLSEPTPADDAQAIVEHAISTYGFLASPTRSF